MDVRLLLIETNRNSYNCTFSPRGEHNIYPTLFRRKLALQEKLNNEWLRDIVLTS